MSSTAEMGAAEERALHRARGIIKSMQFEAKLKGINYFTPEKLRPRLERLIDLFHNINPILMHDFAKLPDPNYIITAKLAKKLLYFATKEDMKMPPSLNIWIIAMLQFKRMRQREAAKECTV
jgi:hypothetical protein